MKYIPVHIILFTALHAYVGMELNVNMQAEWGLENGDRATSLCSFSATTPPQSRTQTLLYRTRKKGLVKRVFNFGSVRQDLDAANQIAERQLRHGHV